MSREFGDSDLWKTWHRCENQIIFYLYKGKVTDYVYMGVYTLEMILTKRVANTRGGWEKHFVFIKKRKLMSLSR